ncbi:MAG: DnaD domain protein [Bacillota bacterium]
MSFCKLSNNFINSGYTLIENEFLLSHMPGADPIDIKVYLYGLALANSDYENNNSMEKIALCLKLPEERIIQAFRYWQKSGLVDISSTSPPVVTYLPVKNSLPPIVKYKTKEYSTFVDELYRLFPEKVLSPNSITEFVDLIKATKMETNAMLMIIKYCIDYKNGKASTPYILSVADDWTKKGLITEEKVNEHITSLEANSEAIRQIFSSLGLKREPNLDDRQLYVKWTKEYGYNLDAILVAARAQKRRGGMQRLDRYIEELKNARAFSAQEINEYSKNKQAVYDLSINVVKNIGGYYASMDIVIETYIVPWLSKGFTYESLLTIAKYCFLKNIKNLDGMQQMVDSFYKMGLLDKDSINNYIEKQIEIDHKIKSIFEKCNYMGLVTIRDREYYRTWMEWGFNDEIISYVASLAKKNPFPIQTINRNLGILFQKNIKTLDEAKNILKKEIRTDRVQYSYGESVDDSYIYNYNKALEIINNRRNLAELKVKNTLDKLRADKKYSKLENKMGELKFEIAKREAQNKSLGSLPDEFDQVKQDYNNHLKALGYTSDDLLIKYVCKECKDTGYVKGKKCKCLTDLIYNEK